MIFHPDLLAKILDGRKTQTRRPVVAGKPCRYRPGRDYAIQPGRGKHAAGRVRVVAVNEVPVGAISVGDARAEGFSSPAAFFARWRELYGNVDGRCWRIEFRLVTPA